MSILLSGEMEVDGDLKVIGNVQVGTIDSLEQEIVSLKLIIAQLQAQIALLQSQISLIGGDLGYADCAGVVGGSAVIDDCGICDGSNESMDVCGLCGGDTQNIDDCNFALSFDGVNDYVYIGLPNGMSPTGSHSFILKIKNNTPACEWGGIIGADIENAHNQNETLHYGFRGCEDNCPGGSCMSMDFYANTLYASSSLINTWTHWVLTYDASTLRRVIYQDGQLVAEDNSSGQTPGGYGGIFEVIIGADGNDNTIEFGFIGVIDDLSIWSKALDQGEASNYISSNPTGNEAGLEALYNFNEGSDNILNDLSGNGNHGTIHGNPVWVEH